jgi:thiamine biosynthesis lipoprotein
VRAGVRLDAGGVAKGYAADQARDVLAEAGFSRALVVAGGDLSIGDPPPGRRGWNVALAGLDPDRAAPGSPLMLARCGVSTSGDAEQWVEIGGVRYSHIVDPRTGKALQGRRSDSVVAANATSSDMLATALSVLGPDEGARLVARYPGAASLVGMRTKTGDHWVKSERWNRITGHP